ncbi:hypothetical protein [Spirosoma rhododendri]|uniref:Glycerophosphoryl diester phosphodiesterase membrane domain-containing protein n=1 Tax=Spirosoma rhododendri TaxID=2728024 RepID=A0A7L5DPB7_9BACT|nr:hypothetical protein [Spirosoma rhododendri]QJD78348.1 hypothetical protein HH216_07850 [Spirosoma rhododendri]
MNNLYVQRDFGEKINAVFQYIRQHYRSLLLSLLYIVGPVAVVTAVASSFTLNNVLRAASDAQTDAGNPYAGLLFMTRLLSPSYWLSLLFGVLTNVAVILTTYAHLHRTETGQTATVADIWDDMQSQIGRMVVYTILISIITSIGFFCLLLPGIYIGIVLSIGFAITYFEKAGFGEAWARCLNLIRDNWWATFGYLLVIVIIVGILSLVFALPGGLVGFLSAGKLLPGDGLPIWLIIANIIGLIGRSILYSIIYLAIAFQYGNLVEQHENVSLHSAINSIGTTPTKPRTTDEGDF